MKPPKPKPPVTVVRLRTIIMTAAAATLLTVASAWGVVDGGWPIVLFNLSLGLTALLWVGTIAFAHARHVTRYTRTCTWECTKQVSQQTARFERLMRDDHERIVHLIRWGGTIDEAERALRG